MRLQLCCNTIKIVSYQIDWFDRYFLSSLMCSSLGGRAPQPAPQTLQFPPDSPLSAAKTNVLVIVRDIFVLSTKTRFFQPFVLSSHSIRHFLLGVYFAVMGFFRRLCYCFLSERKGCKNSMDYLLNSWSCFERLFFFFECLIMILFLDAFCIKEVKLLKKWFNHFKTNTL